MTKYNINFILPEGNNFDSIILELDDYRTFCLTLYNAICDCFEEHNNWHLTAINADIYLAESSKIRRYKGYTNLFLSEFGKIPDMSFKDGFYSPKLGQEILYASVTGSGKTWLNLINLGMKGNSSFLVCSKDKLSDEELLGGLKQALQIKKTDEVFWNFDKLYQFLPEVVFISGSESFLPLGLYRKYGFCATLPIISKLINFLTIN